MMRDKKKGGDKKGYKRKGYGDGTRRSEKERGRMPPPHCFWPVKVSLHCAITAAGDRL